jgi:hypothetical protein
MPPESHISAFGSPIPIAALSTAARESGVPDKSKPLTGLTPRVAEPLPPQRTSLPTRSRAALERTADANQEIGGPNDGMMETVGPANAEDRLASERVWPALTARIAR